MFIDYIQKRPVLNFAFQIFIAVVAALSTAVGLNLFLVPGDIFSSGTTGIAQIINYFADQIPVIGPLLTIGNLFLILNIPIIILSWVKLGKHFTVMTLLVVVLSMIATNMIPVIQVSANPLLNAIMGGAIAGVASGITIKYGMSCGGLDIISLVLSRITGSNVGSLGFAINLLIILASGLLFDWEYALYTLISIYVLSKTIDGIHTSEHRLTAFIVTNQTDDVVNAIYKSIVRGVTILQGQGGYSRDKRDVLMVVINRYEMFSLQNAVKQADDNAFVNIIHSTKVVGHFFTRDQQKAMKWQVKKVEKEQQQDSDDSEGLLSSNLDFDQLYEQVPDMED